MTTAQKILESTSSWIVALAPAAVFAVLAYFAAPAISRIGFEVFFGSIWSPAYGKFGGAAFFYAAFLTSILAVVFSAPFVAIISIFLTQYADGLLGRLIKNSVELFALIPAVVYGLCALTVVVPFVEDLQIAFGVESPNGYGILSASIVLAFISAPYATFLASKALGSAPDKLIKAAYSLGATKREIILRTLLPKAAPGIAAAFFISFGRCLGEAIAVAMVVGGGAMFAESVFSRGDTVASFLATNFLSSESDMTLSVMAEAGLALAGFSAIFHFAGGALFRQIWRGDVNI